MNRIKKLYSCVHDTVTMWRLGQEDPEELVNQVNERHNSYGYMYNTWSKCLDTVVYGNVQVTYIAINSWGVTILVFTLMTLYM